MKGVTLLIVHVMIVLAMTTTSRRPVRSEACIPAAAGKVEQAQALRKSRKMGQIKSGCRCTVIRNRPGKPDKCIVPCPPEQMRATTESNLHASGLYPPNKRLDLQTYIMARNIASEAGSRATGAEKLVLGEALIHRSRESGKSFAQIALFNGTRFGAQVGKNPAVATAQNPAFEDIVAAELVMSGESGNLGRGATHYFSPNGMDARKNKGIDSRGRFGLYDQWTSGGDLLTWVGYVPGINTDRQFLLKKLPKTAAGRAEHARMRPLGRQALANPTPDSVFNAPVCSRFTGGSILGFAGILMVSAALPAFLISRYG